MPAKNAASGAPDLSLRRLRVRAEHDDELVFLQLRYLPHEAAHPSGAGCPPLSPTLEQCAQLASALQQQILAAKGQSSPPSNVTPLRH